MPFTIHHAPNAKIRKQIGAELRAVWNAQDRETADANLATIAVRYEKKAPKLANWLLDNVPEGLSVFALPSAHQRKMRTTNGIERPIQQEIKRRTQLVRVFPNEAALLRLVSAILVEIDDDWTSADKRYIVWNDNDDPD
jgi:transposase-like protein